MASLRLTSAVFCLLCAFCALARAEDAPFVKVHEGKHWIWFARQDQYDAHKADIEALYDYADAAFDKLCDAWGLKPPGDQYALLVWDKTGGGFAAATSARHAANPSPLRTAYVAAYLEIGAPEDISAVLAAQVPGYDAAKVRGILRARQTWTALPANTPRRTTLQAAYLNGDYQASLR